MRAVFENFSSARVFDFVCETSGGMRVNQDGAA
jgi:hypothetical protein